eukprot:346581-Prorocentrum_minimum.AAC.1
MSARGRPKPKRGATAFKRRGAPYRAQPRAPLGTPAAQRGATHRPPPPSSGSGYISSLTALGAAGVDEHSDHLGVALVGGGVHGGDVVEVGGRCVRLQLHQHLRRLQLTLPRRVHQRLVPLLVPLVNLPGEK